MNEGNKVLVNTYHVIIEIVRCRTIVIPLYCTQNIFTEVVVFVLVVVFDVAS